MAGSEEEKELWISAIRRAIEKGIGTEGAALLMSAGLANMPPGGEISQSDALNELMDDSGNHRCFECHVPLDSPNWVSINLGILLCISCSGHHRHLGTHVSKVRSLTLDKLPPAQMEILRRLGNARAAKIWEARPGVEEARAHGLAQFIKEKYINKAFLSDGELMDSSDAFETVLARDNLKKVAHFVAHGRPPFYVTGKTTALHVAASEPSMSSALAEFLILNGADIGALDEHGKTPADVATEAKSTKVLSVLRSWAATSYVKASGALVSEDI